jgi:hypothetical protein
MYFEFTIFINTDVDYIITTGPKASNVYNLTCNALIHLCHLSPDRTVVMMVNDFTLDKIRKTATAPQHSQKEIPTLTQNQPSFDDILRLTMRMMDECRESREFITKKEERDAAAKKEEKEAEMSMRREEKAEAVKKEERDAAIKKEERVESARQHNEILSMLVRVMTPNVPAPVAPSAQIAIAVPQDDVAMDAVAAPPISVPISSPPAKPLQPSLYFRTKNVPQDPKKNLYCFMVAISNMHMRMRGYPTRWAICGSSTNRPVYHESDLDIFDAAWIAYSKEVSTRSITSISATPTTKRGRLDAVKDPRQPDIRTKFPRLSSDRESVVSNVSINAI